MSVESCETAKHRGVCFVVTLLASVCLVSALPVGAQAQFWPWGGYEQRRYNSYERDRQREWERAQRQRRQQRELGKAGKRDRSTPKESEGPILAVVSLSSQRINVYGRRGHLAESVVSSGKPGHRTPTGIFSVIQKSLYHESNIYSGAPMPWMQRLTWSGIALHGGVVPRNPASHGCIRMTHEFAARMWDLTRLGARVVVSPYDVEAVSFTHAALPVPAMTEKASDTVAGGKMMGPPALEVATASSATVTGASLDSGTITHNIEGPQRRARAARTAAVANARAADAALKPAQAAARKASVAANAARNELKRAQRVHDVAEARVAALAKRKTVKPEAEEAARKAIDVAKARVAGATEKEARASEVATTAAQMARDAQVRRTSAAAQMQATAFALDPVSVFVSGKDGRIYLRQGFAPLMDAPVTIRDTGERLGTHAFKAMSTSEDGSSVEWLAVTVPDAGSEGRTEARRDRQLNKAREALDRIEISPAIRAEISNRLWAGASLIISDHGLNHETGRGTDFVVLTK